MAVTNAWPSTSRPRPLVIDPGRTFERCMKCDARADSVCNAIGEADLARLSAVAVLTDVPPGTTFIEEGQPAEDFYNITAGTVRLYKLLPDGRRQITGFAAAGVFLGLAVSATYAFSAEAIDKVRYCRFPRRKLQALLDDFPAMEKRLLQTASNELVAAQEQMLLLGRKTARERLASFLFAQHTHTSPCMPGRDEITLAMTRNDIADYLGLTIETVSRTFTRLRKENLIAVPNTSTVVIIDAKGLANLAEGFAGSE
jgi:CRP/FNR family transcriptional regulator